MLLNTCIKTHLITFFSVLEFAFLSYFECLLANNRGSKVEFPRRSGTDDAWRIKSNEKYLFLYMKKSSIVKPCKSFFSVTICPTERWAKKLEIFFFTGFKWVADKWIISLLQRCTWTTWNQRPQSVTGSQLSSVRRQPQHMWMEKTYWGQLLVTLQCNLLSRRPGTLV